MPRGFKTANKYNLDKWVQHQRIAINSGTLSEDRRIRLQEIGFDPTPFDSQWEAKFNLLKTYYEKNGNSNVNSRDPNRELARWVIKQRTKYREDKLAEYQVKTLQKLNFEFSRGEFDRKSFDYLPYQEAEKIVREKKFSSSVAFQSWARGKSPEYGDFPDNLPRSPQQVYLNSGWIDWPIFLGKGNREEENERLWLEMLDQYRNFLILAGKIPINQSPADKKLANWLSTQRIQFKKGILSEEREKALVQVGFSFDPIEDLFNYSYQQLLQFVEREGHSIVKRNFRQGDFNLGAWVNHIKDIRSKLSSEKLALFNNLPGWTWDRG